MDIAGLIHLLIWLIVIGLIFWLLYWLIGQVGLPEPFRKVALVILAIIVVLVLVNLLLGIVGTPMIRLK